MVINAHLSEDDPAGYSRLVDRFRRDLFVDGDESIDAEAYRRIVRGTMSLYGIPIGVAGLRQFLNSLVEMRFNELHRFTGGSADEAREAEARVGMTALGLGEQSGHCDTTGNQHYGGGQQQVKGLSRAKIHRVHILVASQYHVMLMPKLLTDPEWQRKWQPRDPTEILAQVRSPPLVVLIVEEAS